MLGGNSTFGHVFVLEYASKDYLLCCTVSARRCIYNSLSLLTDLQILCCIHSAVQRFPELIFYRFPSSAIYRAVIELGS
jgi:hypothetical protein